MAINLRQLAAIITGANDPRPQIKQGFDLIQNEFDAQSARATAIAKSIPATVTVGGVVPPDPGSAIGTPWYGYDDAGKLWIKSDRTPPSPLGTYKGDHCYYESPDQSSGTPLVVGSTALGSGAALGDWTPRDGGRSPYDPGAPGPLVVTGLDPVSTETIIRVYYPPYSDDVDTPLVRHGKVGQSPSFTITVEPQSVYAAAIEYAPNVKSVTAIVGAEELRSGVSYTPLTVQVVLPDTDPAFQGWEPWGWWDGDDISKAFSFGPITNLTFEIASVRTPATASTGLTVFGVSVGKDKTGNLTRNTIDPLVTPKAHVTAGATAGTVDPLALLTTNLSAELGHTSGVFGVLPAGITNSLVAAAAIDTINLVNSAVGNSKIANFAVDAAKIANASIQNAHFDRATVNKIAIVDADIVNLAAAKISAGTLVAGVIYSGTINANKINAGTMSGVALVLNDNGVTTTVNNATDATLSSPAGIKVQDNSSPFGYSTVTPTGFAAFKDSSSPFTFRIVINPWIAFTSSASIKITGTNTSTNALELYVDSGLVQVKINNTRVLTNRQTGPGTPSFATVADAQTWCAALKACLDASGHGLIT